MGEKTGPKCKYRPEMCDKVIGLLSEGQSLYEVAAALKITYRQLRRWEEKFEDFSDAMELGRTLSQAHWERMGRNNLTNKEFNYVGWYMQMKNRFGYRDKLEQMISEEPKVINAEPVSENEWETKYSLEPPAGPPKSIN